MRRFPTSFSVLGLAAHATHFVVFFAVAGLLLLLSAIDTGKLWQFFASGVLLGLAFLVKQPGFAFAAFGWLYLVFREWKHPSERKSLLAKAGTYSAGVVLPFALTCLILLAAGVFRNFWFWVFAYAGQYTSETSVPFGVAMFMHVFPGMVGSAVWMWIIAGVGLSAFWWDRESRRHAMFIGGLLFFSFLAVCPGLFFRDHYFILMLPAVAVLVGMGVQAATKVLTRKGGLALAAIPALVFSAAGGYALMNQKAFLFEMDPCGGMPGTVQHESFSGSQGDGGDTLKHTRHQVTELRCSGSEPEIYFYAKRHSATGFIYMYGLMEQQKYSLEMQKEMIGEIESARPTYLVVVKSRLSWLPKEGSPEAASMSAWMGGYLSEYELMGVAERLGDHTEYHWGDDAKAYQPHSQNIVGIFKRKS